MKLKDIAIELSESEEYKELVNIMNQLTYENKEETADRIVTLIRIISSKIVEKWQEFIGQVSKSWVLKGTQGEISQNSFQQALDLEKQLDQHIKSTMPVYWEIHKEIKQAEVLEKQK